MTSAGEEYKTEFGEFLDFTTESMDKTPVCEPFQDFLSIDKIPLSKSPLYSQIGEIIEKVKEEKTSK